MSLKYLTDSIPLDNPTMHNRGSSFDPTTSKSAPGGNDDDDVWDCHIGEVNQQVRNVHMNAG